MSSHPRNSPLPSHLALPLHTDLPADRRGEVIAEAKAHAHALREQALDAAWSALRRQLGLRLAQLRQALWPQSRRPRKEASRPATIVTRRGQNRPRGPLRLMDP